MSYVFEGFLAVTMLRICHLLWRIAEELKEANTNRRAEIVLQCMGKRES